MAIGLDYLTMTSTSIPPRFLFDSNHTSELDELVVREVSSTPVSSSSTPASESRGLQNIRIALSIMHLFLVCIGSVNLLVVFVIAFRRYMRSITNVYIVSLCLADFIYLFNLTLVAATQLNDKSWPFGTTLCTVYHGTESTGKYASVIFVVLLACDRYCAMCRPHLCARYRNYRIALGLSLMAWLLALLAALPLFSYSDDIIFGSKKLCIIKWPSSESARWYITISSVLIFAIPLTLIVFFYYHILNKLREAVKGNKRMRRAASSRAPYHRVTRLVLWIVIFHVICWTPFWCFNLLTSVFQMRIVTQFDRVVLNVIHLFPYLNCALNPLVYAINAENFRRAFRSIFCLTQHRGSTADSRFMSNGLSTRSVIVNGMNASAERLLSANHELGELMNQKCSNAALLNGSVFLPHAPNVKRLSKNLSVVGGKEESEVYRPSGTVVRFATIDSGDDYASVESGNEDDLKGDSDEKEFALNAIDNTQSATLKGNGYNPATTEGATSLNNYYGQDCEGEMLEGDVFM